VSKHLTSLGLGENVWRRLKTAFRLATVFTVFVWEVIGLGAVLTWLCGNHAGWQDVLREGSE